MYFGVEVVRDRSAILRAIVLFSRSRTFSSRELATSSVKPARAHISVYIHLYLRDMYISVIRDTRGVHILEMSHGPASQPLMKLRDSGEMRLQERRAKDVALC